MDEFWKASAAALLTVVLVLSLGKREKDISVLLTMAVCCMVTVTAITYLEPVLDLLWELESMANVQGGMMEILMKAVGIGLVVEIAGMICTDSGNSSLGKTIQTLGTVVILYLSIPLFRGFLTLIQEILGQV